MLSIKTKRLELFEHYGISKSINNIIQQLKSLKTNHKISSHESILILIAFVGKTLCQEN